jgi:Cu-Zn family superoxide dismutase
MRIATLALLGAATIGLTACDKSGVDTGTPVAGGQRATAMLQNANGVAVGRATATEVAGGMRFTLDAMALPPGTHGTHIHDRPLRCAGLHDGRRPLEPDRRKARQHEPARPA